MRFLVPTVSQWGYTAETTLNSKLKTTKAYFLPSLHVHSFSRTQADRAMQISMLGKQEKCLVGKWPITSTRNSSIRRDYSVPPNPRGTGSAALPFWAAKSWKYWWAALVTTTVHPSAQQMFGPYSNLQAKYTPPLPTEDIPQVSSYHGVQLKQQDLGITGMVSTSGLNWLLLIQRSMNLKVLYDSQQWWKRDRISAMMVEQLLGHGNSEFCWQMVEGQRLSWEWAIFLH